MNSKLTNLTINDNITTMEVLESVHNLMTPVCESFSDYKFEVAEVSTPCNTDIDLRIKILVNSDKKDSNFSFELMEAIESKLSDSIECSGFPYDNNTITISSPSDRVSAEYSIFMYNGELPLMFRKPF